EGGGRLDGGHPARVAARCPSSPRPVNPQLNEGGGGGMMLRRIAFAVVLSVAVLAAVGIAVAATSSSTAAPVGSGKASPTKSVCGLGTGKKATGTPINIGAIVTVAPGVNWDEITDNVRAYFNCVNDNGGIWGRP